MEELKPLDMILREKKHQKQMQKRNVRGKNNLNKNVKISAQILEHKIESSENAKDNII